MRMRRGLRIVGGIEEDLVLQLRGSLEYFIHVVIQVLAFDSSTLPKGSKA